MRIESNDVLAKYIFSSQNVTGRMVRAPASRALGREFYPGLCSYSAFAIICNGSLLQVRPMILSAFNIGVNHIIKFPITWDCLNIKCKSHLHSFLFQDKSLPKTTIESLFEDTIRTHFSNFSLIATDASKSQQITSIAGTSSTNSFAYRLQHLNYIFSAEALALCQALDELPKDEDNLLLLTDSLSVLRALANLSIKSHKIIPRLAAKISTREKFHQNIVLLWTSGIKWNEKADTLSRRFQNPISTSNGLQSKISSHN
ncbi:hypothetical protein AVEN_150172-1 [Araneus ventricosus]|uniref:Uncharacterized protein n=1 Tax=Araneus ventricosus TaxID=182803 RepID=A0A4Y2VTM5_ARAVE|nr:hypothetical protein AVEN_40462-1 [Araneus ventricosus]GBO28031.1 hypothetical protein AVEN_150172-1 [Araneus ventricosus]